MPATKRLIICAICFVAVLVVGLLWSHSDPTKLTDAQHLIIVTLLAGFVTTALFFILRQSDTIRQIRLSAQKSDLARDEFAASISHELRTPLSGIIGVMHLLKRTSLDRNQQRYVDTASNSANMLLAIINDVIAFTRFESAGFFIESETFEPSEIIEDVTSILAPEAISKGLEMVCDVDPEIPQRARGDALRLRQVLNSLVNNAIKYTEQGLVVVYAKVLDSSIQIGVRDTGTGIDQARQLALLDDGIPQGVSHGGSGLGLKTSKSLISAMDSELRVDSVVGEGSCFYFDLPLDGTLSAGYDWNPPPDMRNLTVGILSPFERRRDYFRNLLAHWQLVDFQGLDYDVEKEQELPAISPCNVLFVDQTRTEQSVNDFIDRMRNQSDWRETSFIHLLPQNRTGDGGSADRRLHKPLSQTRLYATLMEVIYKRAYHSEYGEETGVTSEQAAAKILAGRRILLVEDNDINKMIALEMLEETGVDIDIAINGAEALEQVQRQGYELILMDIQMPVMDGYEATREIRALGGEFTTVPIIAMTAHALDGDSRKSLEAGMNDHIAKPFEPDNLIAIVVKFIEERNQ